MKLLVACMLVAPSARADELSEVLDVVRSVAQIIAPTQEARISAQLQRTAGEVEAAVALATALFQNNPVRGGAIDVGVITGGGFDIDRAGADAAAMFSAHLDTDRCSLLSADVLARGRTATSVDDRARPSLDGSLGACFPEGLSLAESGLPIAAFPIRGRVHGALNKTPSLTASRTLIPEPYSETGWGVWMEGMRYLWSENRKYAAGPGITIEQRYHWRGSPAGEASREEIIGDAYFVRLARRRPPNTLADRAIDILGFGFHGVQDEQGVAVGEFWPLRVSGLGLLSDHVLLDFVMGVSAPGTLTEEDGNVIDSANVPKRTIAFVHSALSVGDPRFAVGVSYDRGLDTNLLIELVQEDRGTLWVRQRRGDLRYSASALVTRALHFPDKTTRGEERLVGAAFDGTYAVGGGVAVGIQLEATHAFRRDPVLDDRVAPDGIRAFATVSYTHRLVDYVRASEPQ